MERSKGRHVLFLLMLAIFIVTALIRSADEHGFESTKPRQAKVNPLPNISGSDICRWSRNAGASSCSIDQSNQIIFMTVHTNASEASKMCHGMQSMLRQYGGTGWRITIRSLLGPVLATCR